MHHIFHSILLIEKFVDGFSRDDFANDRMRYDAILRNLQTIAESTQKLPLDLKNHYAQIPWREIAGFRNILVQDYLNWINAEIIWWIVSNELPLLKSIIAENIYIIVTPYNDKYHNQVVNLILNIQQKEFSIPITHQDQPDLDKINNYYNNFWVACFENTIVGTIGLKIFENFAVIRKMFVDKNFRGKKLGIAKQLLLKLEEECSERNINKIYLGTTEHFKAAHKFYEENSYNEIAKHNLPINFPKMLVDNKFYFKQL